MAGATTLWMVSLSVSSRWLKVLALTTGLLWYAWGRVLILTFTFKDLIQRKLPRVPILSLGLCLALLALCGTDEIRNWLIRGEHNFDLSPADGLINLLLTPIVLLGPPLERFQISNSAFAGDTAHSILWLLSNPLPPLTFVGAAGLLYGLWKMRRDDFLWISSLLILVLATAASPSYTHLHIATWVCTYFVGIAAFHLPEKFSPQLILFCGLLMVGQSLLFVQNFGETSEVAYTNRVGHIQRHFAKSESPVVLLSGMYDEKSIRWQLRKSRIVFLPADDPTSTTANLFRRTRGQKFHLVFDQEPADPWNERELYDQRALIDEMKIQLGETFKILKYEELRFQERSYAESYWLDWKDNERGQ